MAIKSRRGMGLRDVAFMFDDGRELPVPGVARIRSGLTNDGRAVCLLSTMDIDFARGLAAGTIVRLVGRLRDARTREPEEGRTEFGRFRVLGPPLISGGAREFTVAKIRLAEEPGPILRISCTVGLRPDDAEPGVPIDGPAPAGSGSGSEPYRSFFFDERGGPITREADGA